MDPQGVRAVGGGLDELASRARVVAAGLADLELKETHDGCGLAADVTPVLAVWVDGLTALGTELGLLERACAESARGVEREDDAARHRFAQRPASPRRPDGS